MWRGHADVRLRHVEVRLWSQHVKVRHVKWSCIGGAARRKCQCANYREVGSKMPRHGFSPSPFSLRPPACVSRIRITESRWTLIGGQVCDQRHNCGKKRQNVMVVTEAGPVSD